MEHRVNPELPPDYRIVDKNSVFPKDVLEVRRSVGWDADRPESESTFAACIAQSIAVVGVMTGDALVGVGFLSGTVRHAVLCDFAVRPEHQHRGIGRAILVERLRIARELGVRYLYVNLSPRNPLRQFYQESGFVEGPGCLFCSLGPIPPSPE